MALQFQSRVATVARAKGIPTIQALARATGDRSTVRLWWNRTPERFMALTLCRLCAALGAQPGDLIAIVDG